MAHKKSEMYESKTKSENKAYLAEEERESRRIAQKFKKKTKLTKNL